MTYKLLKFDTNNKIILINPIYDNINNFPANSICFEEEISEFENNTSSKLNPLKILYFPANKSLNCEYINGMYDQKIDCQKISQSINFLQQNYRTYFYKC